MKKIKILFIASALVMFSNLKTNAQLTIKSGGSGYITTLLPTGPEVGRFGQGLVSQLQNGTVGGFTQNDRWSGFGSLSAASQQLTGFRTQTNGRGLTFGHRIPNGGSVSNPFIEWIGNDDAQVGTTPGNLDFRVANNPTNAASNVLFSIKPGTNASTDLAFSFAAGKSFLGHCTDPAGTSFGSFTNNDTWSATGLISPGGVNSFYGQRHQIEGFTLINGLQLKNGGTPNQAIDGVIDFGYNLNSFNATRPPNLIFRNFSDPLDPTTVQNTMTLGGGRNKGVIVSRRDITALSTSPNTLNFGVFDGPTADISNTALTFINRAGIYATSDGSFDDGSQIQNYGAIVGDVSLTNAGLFKVGVLGVSDANYAGGFSNNRWAGYFIGRVGYTGTLVSVSDGKYKTDIKTENNIMEKVMQLNPKNYFFNYEKNKNMALSNKLQHGFLSEEVEKIFPELVEEAFAPSTTNDPKTNGKPEAYKGLNYIGFIPVLTKAIQEQQIQIDELKKELAAVKNTETFVVNKTATPTEKEILENKAYMLAQNVPNPFTQSTIIKYSLPNATDKAMITIFNLNGSLIQQFNLASTKGTNQITINGSSLAAGKYIYSLLINGEEVISKTMILTR